MMEINKYGTALVGQSVKRITKAPGGVHFMNVPDAFVKHLNCIAKMKVITNTVSGVVTITLTPTKEENNET
jgi:hypothetical protein